MDRNELDDLLPMLTDAKERRGAFSSLVRLTQERLYWHVRKMVLVHDDANDVLQNTYLKAWRSLDSFRGECQIYTWLYRIATNETLTFLASQRMKNVSSPIDYEDLMISRMEADVYYEGDEMQKKFQRAVLALPEKQRLVFNMRYYDDMKYDDIAEITGTSVGALKASYHHAVRKIEQFVKEED